MANTVSGALVPEVWKAAIQKNIEETLVALEVCDTKLEADLKVGDKIHFPYINALSAQVYTPGTVITAQAFTANDDSIDVNTFKVVPFYVDNVYEMQSNQDYAAHVAQDAGYQLRQDIDATALANVSSGILFGESNASGEAGTYTTGTSATVTALASTSGDIDDYFVSAREWLRKMNVTEDGDWVAVMRPEIMSDIELLAIGSGYKIADATLQNGYAGDFLGFHCYVSNNMTDGHMYLGKRGAIKVVLQKEPGMEIKDVSDQLGKNFLVSDVWGTGVLVNDAKRFFNVLITS